MQAKDSWKVTLAVLKWMRQNGYDDKETERMHRQAIVSYEENLDYLVRVL